MSSTTLPLSSITRISPLNPRHGGDDVSQLAATIAAAGQQYPLLVRRRTDAPEEYEVVDGGRRWRALKQLAADDGDADRNVPVEILEGDEATARRAALVVSITPRALHPVDEFEAFAKLDAAGISIMQIARDFALSERHVKQRLALAALAPCIRAAWRNGVISRDAAEAFTSGPVEVQEATFATWSESSEWKLGRPYDIRRAMRGDDDLDADEPVCRYIAAHPAALETYLTAGGRVHEDLFTESVVLRDPSIAEKVVTEFLLVEATRIADKEGWGEAFAEIDGYWHEYEPELSDAEEARLDQLNRDIWNVDGEEKQALITERDTMVLAAILRELAPDERDRRAVGAFLNSDGNVEIVRGIEQAREEVEEHGAGESGEDLDDDDEKTARDDELQDDADREEEPPRVPEPTKAVREVIEACVTKGLGSAIGARTDIALMFAVAVMGCNYGAIGFRSLSPARLETADELPELLHRISEMSFIEALAECAAAPLCDLTVAFTKLVGSSLSVTNVMSLIGIHALCSAARARGANLETSFNRALDRRSFFQAAPKELTLEIIEQLAGHSEATRAKKMKKDALATFAATLSAEKNHLPAPLSEWAQLPELPGCGDDAEQEAPNQPRSGAHA